MRVLTKAAVVRLGVTHSITCLDSYAAGGLIESTLKVEIPST